MYLKSRILVNIIMLIIFTSVRAIPSSPNFSSADYCKLCVNHTMCIYPTSTPGKNCGSNNVPSPLLDNEIEALVEAHNKYRNNVARGFGKFSSQIQPAATNMKKLSWDYELAAIAQRWADQCEDNKRDSCRDVKDNQVGQNVIAVKYADNNFQTDVLASVRAWYLEGEHFDSRNIEKFSVRDVESSNSSSYSQLVWAESDVVGCGRVINRRTNVEILVCNYAPAGNVEGGRVYRTGGDPAADCPMGTMPDDGYLGLCSNGEWDQDQNDAISALNYELLVKELSKNSGSVPPKCWLLLHAMMLYYCVSCIKF